MAEGTAFNASDPPLRITNPDLAKTATQTPFLEYPRHLHKADGSYCVVTNDLDKAAKITNGWHLSPEAAKAAQAVVRDETVSEAVPLRRPGRPPHRPLTDTAA